MIYFALFLVFVRNHLLGLDGMVKITNPDENVNHVQPSANNCVNPQLQIPQTTVSFDPSTVEKRF